MLDRLAKHAHFWSALTVVTGAGGLFAVRSELPAGSSGVTALINIFGAGSGSIPSFAQAAPLLSLGAFILAIAGWRRLHHEVTRTASADSSSHRDRQWHDAIQANVDGVLLLHAIRDASGSVVDFEISDVNPSAARLLRAQRPLVIGRRLRRDYPAAIGNHLVANYIDAMTSDTPAVEEVRVDRRLFAAGWLYHHAVPTTTGVAVTIRDITIRKREEVRLRRATVTDELTLLSNRRGFLAMAEQQLRVARRHAKDAVLMYIDMDDFKALNDQFGHAEGDRALIAVGRLLRRAVRECDVVARLGGDEFTIMALDADRTGARLIQKRIEERVAALNASGELAAPLSLTIGHTRVRPDDHAPLPELLARADGLLYSRKKRRKLSVALATASASSSMSARSPVKATSKSPTTRVATPTSGKRQSVRGLPRVQRVPETTAWVTAST